MPCKSLRPRAQEIGSLGRCSSLSSAPFAMRGFGGVWKLCLCRDRWVESAPAAPGCFPFASGSL